jgi:uncharacterized protein YbcI
LASTEPPEQAPPADLAAAEASPPSPLTLVTRALVAIYKEQFGRGPRNAHSHYSGPNAITCFLEGTLTPVEKSLAARGQTERLRDIRLFFQYEAESAFRSAVEAATGRKVVGFLSAIDAEADIATEVFVFEPERSADNP